MTTPAADQPREAAARWGVLTESPAARVLERMLAEERVPHALLLAGPPQVGKRELALHLAQALNCDGTSQPCGECRPCRRIEQSLHADVEIVAPGSVCRVSEHDHSTSRVIGICAVRRLEHVAITQPYEGRRRVFVVDPADALTADAADAFLKTLEEPPALVHFVLVSARPELLPETVRSRCRLVPVAPMPVARLGEWLQQQAGIKQETARALAHLAHGRAGWATAALKDGEPLEVRRSQIAEIRRLAAASRADRLQAAEQLAGRSGNDAANVLSVLAVWTDWWRDLLLGASSAETPFVHLEEAAALREDGSRYRSAELGRFLHELDRAVDRVQRGVNARLVLENLFLRIPQPQTDGSPAS